MVSDTTSDRALKRVRLDEPPVEQIHDTLLAAILSLELAPGTRVSEADIARAVGASRTPVRAALARLSEGGLIETRPSRGNYVTRLSADAIRDAHFVRDALETAVAGQLAHHGLPAPAAKQLRGNLSAAATAARRGDADKFGKLDDEFHRLLAAATGHARLVQVLEREKAGLGRVRALCPSEPDYLQYVVQEHTGVLQAIEARDESLARTRVSAHIGRVLTMLDELQQQHADFFEDHLH